MSADMGESYTIDSPADVGWERMSHFVNIMRIVQMNIGVSRSV